MQPVEIEVQPQQQQQPNFNYPEYNYNNGGYIGDQQQQFGQDQGVGIQEVNLSVMRDEHDEKQKKKEEEEEEKKKKKQQQQNNNIHDDGIDEAEDMCCLIYLFYILSRTICRVFRKCVSKCSGGKSEELNSEICTCCKCDCDCKCDAISCGSGGSC